jgi:hypothetical protein
MESIDDSAISTLVAAILNLEDEVWRMRCGGGGVEDEVWRMRCGG